MSQFKDFFHEKEKAHSKHWLTDQEKVNLQALSNHLYNNSGGEVAILTGNNGRTGIAIVRKRALETGKIMAEDILSPVMEGEKRRMKEIFKWLEKNPLAESFKAKKYENISVKPKNKLLKKVSDAIAGEI